MKEPHHPLNGILPNGLLIRFVGGGVKFDLDPCSPIKPLYTIAENAYTIEDDGLAKEWFGKVYLNPPYTRPVIDKFIYKMVKHNNGIALLFDRCDNSLWQDHIFPTATALLYMRGRVKFMRPDGTQGLGAGCGCVLIAWGRECAEMLKQSQIKGFYIQLK